MGKCIIITLEKRKLESCSKNTKGCEDLCQEHITSSGLSMLCDKCGIKRIYLVGSLLNNCSSLYSIVKEIGWELEPLNKDGKTLFTVCPICKE